MKTFFFALLLTLQLSALQVVVSIPPLKFFVDEIGGEAVTTQSLLPPGAGPHSFEPSPKQMATANDAQLWFGIGETFETKVASALPNLPRINLTDGVQLLGGCPHCAQGGDPHIWMSPRLAQAFSRKIAAALIERLPQKRGQIEKNLRNLETKLKKLDSELTGQLAACRGQTILVSHPAFGYFCRDYGLHQLSIEFEGKEPTPRQLTGLLARAKQDKARIVILDGLHGAKGARRVATELGLPLCSNNPMAEDYVENLHRLADCICPQPHD